jgi:hypothetical protein
MKNPGRQSYPLKGKSTGLGSSPRKKRLLLLGTKWRSGLLVLLPLNDSTLYPDTMRPNYRVILMECIENGVRRGYRRVHKHTESPGEDAIFEQIEDCIMSEIVERFFFDFE